jgi:hypothetical protein
MVTDIPDIPTTITIGPSADGLKKRARVTFSYDNDTTPAFFENNATHGNRLAIDTTIQLKRRKPNGTEIVDNNCKKTTRQLFALVETQNVYIGNNNTFANWASTRNDHSTIPKIVDQFHANFARDCTVLIKDMTNAHTTVAFPPGWSVHQPYTLELLSNTQYVVHQLQYINNVVIPNAGFPGDPNYEQYQPGPYHVINNVTPNNGVAYNLNLPNVAASYDFDFRMTGITDNGTTDVACGTVRVEISSANLNRSAQFNLTTSGSTSTFLSENVLTTTYEINDWENTRTITTTNISPQYETPTHHAIQQTGQLLLYNAQAWTVTSSDTNLVTLPISNSKAIVFNGILAANQNEKEYIVTMTNFMDDQELGTSKLRFILKRTPERTVAIRTMNSNWILGNSYLPNTNNINGNYFSYQTFETGHYDLIIYRNTSDPMPTGVSYIYKTRNPVNSDFVMAFNPVPSYGFTITYSINGITQTLPVLAGSTTAKIDYSTNTGVLSGRNKMDMTFNIPVGTSLAIATVTTSLPLEYAVVSTRVRNLATTLVNPVAGLPAAGNNNSWFKADNTAQFVTNNISQIIFNIPKTSKNFGATWLLAQGQIGLAQNGPGTVSINIFGPSGTARCGMRDIETTLSIHPTTRNVVLSKQAGGNGFAWNFVQLIDNL